MDQLCSFPEGAIDVKVLILVVKLQTAFTEYIQESILWLGKHYATQMITAAVGLQHLQTSKSTLQKARNALRDEMFNEQYLYMRRKDGDDRKLKVLDKVCAYEDNIVHMNKRAELQAHRTPETGTGIIEHDEYRRWLNGEISTLWCPGLAGAGKTFAALAVIDDLSKLHATSQNIGLAFLFCEFDRQHQQTMMSVIGVLARQLIAQGQTFCGKVSSDDKPLSFEEKKKIFLLAATSFQTVYLVVDALDEFSSHLDQRQELARLLVGLREAGSTRLQMCITSREAEDVFNELAPATQIRIQASKTEIARHVQKRFFESKHGMLLLHQDPDLLTDVKEAVIIKSDRM